MKYFFFIVSFFMLYLSCLPCGDSKECNVKTEVNISTADNHQEHNHEAESCTPFCFCSCCAVSAFYNSFPKTQDTKIVFQPEKHLLYNIALNTEVYYSIWQPPKIS